ncbi:abortive infection family protein [Rhizobium leguminosarum]|uniref:abortive infection family protein n=1 Tax=Rhizobium leguminosarum TaxID=384 RepID=UPI001C905928|nr:abortive infection family protein [Rhizobium leguminosarum]MBY3060341.1 abortive infection family protein [Rhizobium leguminosarum]
MVKELRHLLACAISDAKAYDVPGLCRRLGLADGDEQEAFASKYKYAQKRIIEVSAEQVVASAQLLAAEEQHFELSEQLAKIDELKGAAVTTLTRRRLIALFEGRPLAREIDDLELIRSLWPIATMCAPNPSDESCLEDYLHRHTIRNDDLSQRDVLETLGLLTCSRAQLFKFLAAVTAPEAFSGHEQVELAEKIDLLLRHDGYTLALAGRISGSPYYVVRPAPVGSPADDSISATLAAFDPTQVHARWTMAMERRASEPEGAITLARTLLEDVCKWILDQSGETWQEADDLPVLYRKLAKVLKLAPDDHTEQVFKQILGSCQSVVESLGALRNKLGDAHSSGPKRARPQPRHAELAVNLAGAMATFLVATWEARKGAVSGASSKVLE